MYKVYQQYCRNLAGSLIVVASIIILVLLGLAVETTEWGVSAQQARRAVPISQSTQDNQSSAQGVHLVTDSTKANLQTTDIRFPSPFALGLTGNSSNQSCSNTAVPKLLFTDAHKYGDMKWDLSADLSIAIVHEGKIIEPSKNPNHFIHDQWNPVMFAIANCLNGVGEKTRRISIPSLREVPHFRFCRHFIHKADPLWQKFFRENKVGTLVPEDRHLSKSEMEMVAENCYYAHWFAPGVTYFTALLLAGPNGSIVEFDNESRNEPQFTAENPVRWAVDWGSRLAFRMFFGVNERVTHHTGTGKMPGLRNAFHGFRKLVYYYVLPSNIESLLEEDSISCRIVLYDRSKEIGNSRTWQDSHLVHRDLEFEFPKSRIIQVPRLPARFADQVLLFSGVDVFIGIHGGWAPNAMFLNTLTGRKIVLETPRWCDKKIGHEWMEPLRNHSGIEIVELDCEPGTILDSQLIYNKSMPIILATLRNLCH